MSDVKFVLETVSNAFGPGDDIPWHKARCEEFTTLAKARMACDRDQAEMVRRCGSAAWDSHRRIVPTEDTAVIFHLVCSGTVSGDWCPDWKEARVLVAWPAGEPRPFPEPPTGWHTTYQCNACAEREQVREALYAEYDQQERLLYTRDAFEEYGVPIPSITLACRDGKIADARKTRYGWQFSANALRAWMARRPGPGRPRKESRGT